MRMPRNAAPAVLLGALLAPSDAAAAPAFGARAFGGYSTHAMGDWDDVLRGLGLPAGSQRPVDAGYSIGLGTELVWSPAVSVIGAYERLVPVGAGEVNGRKLRLPANALLLDVEYRRHVRPRLSLGAGGGAAYYQLGEEVESPGTTRNFEGDGFGGRAFGFGEWELTPRVSFALGIGYRWARVEVNTVNRAPPANDTKVDYSGLNSRLELRLHPSAAR